MKHSRTKQINNSIQLALLFLLMFGVNLHGQESSIHISLWGNDKFEGTEIKPEN